MQRKYDYDYSKLKGKLREKNLNYKQFGELLGLAEATVSERLNNNAQFTQGEIERAMLTLDGSLQNADAYFFTHLV